MELKITKKDKNFLLLFFALFVLLGYTGFYLFKETILVGLIILMPMAILFIMFEFYRRLREMNSQIKYQQSQFHALQKNNYRQVESLFSIFFTIKPELPLPDMRGWAASPDFLERVAEEVMDHKPNLVVEASSGISTLIIAYCLRKNGRGKVLSLESNKKFFEKSKKLIDKHKLNDYSSVIHAPLKKTTIGGKSFQWYDTASLKFNAPIDMLIVDGPIGSLQNLSRYPALPKFYDHLCEDAIILLDDGSRNDEQKIIKLWEEKYRNIESEYLDFEKGGFIIHMNSQKYFEHINN